MWRSMGRHLGRAILLAGALPAVGYAAPTADNFHILYHESVTELRFDERSADEFLAQRAAERPATTRASFSALGMQFELELDSNNRLIARLAAKSRDSILEQYSLLRGKLVGIDNSWVRLTASGDTISGAIWDGSELYAIEPAGSVRRFAVQPVSAQSDTEPLIYRWSDTRLPPGMQFCGVDSTAVSLSGIDQYKGMVRELRQAFQAAAVPTSEINMGVVADFEAFQFFGGTTQATTAMITRMNTVDGIYSDQVGVQINITENIVFDQSNDPFSGTDEPGTLLDELAFYKRDVTSGLTDEGLVHLFTGRDLMDNTVGVAFMGAICPTPCQLQAGQLGDCAAGLTESRSGPTLDALIAAHEIGHNFNAPHDAEPGSACAAEQTGFLMEAALNGSSTFSPCSLSEMAPIIAAASCITPIADSDLEVSLPLDPINALLGGAFDYQVRVVNIGAGVAGTNSVNVTLDPSLAFLGATGQLGICSTGAGSVDCNISDLNSGAERILTLNLLATQIGMYPSDVTVATASNDVDPTNNMISTLVIVDPAIDLVATPLSDPNFARINDNITLGWAVTNNTIIAATDLSVDMTVPTGLSILQATGDGCLINGQSVNCSPAPMAAGTTSNFTVDLQINQAGNFALQINVSSSTLPDVQPANNSGNISLTSGERVVSRGINLTNPTGSLPVNQSFDAPFAVSNIGPDDARDVVATINVPADVVVNAARVDQGMCSIAGTTVTCDVGDVSAGSNIAGVVTVMPTAVGNRTITGSITGNALDVDPVPGDDNSQQTYVIASGQGGGGNNSSGGGATDLPFALLLMSLILIGLRRSKGVTAVKSEK